jgi:ornithine decarboxylase
MQVESTYNHDYLSMNNICEQNPMLEAEKLSQCPNDDVSAHASLFEEFGASFISKEVSSRSIVTDFCETVESDDPFYIVDLSKIVRQFLKWKKNLPRVKPFYAVKCNPSAHLLRVLEALGAGFDCASKQEIASVLSLGVDPAKRIIYANPCKQASHIRYARSGGVEMCTFDNEDELYKLRTHWPESRIVLRIKTDDSKSVCQFSSKFGASMKDVPRLIKVGKELGLNLVGVSFHVGSGCYDTMSYVKALKDAKKVFEIAEEHGYKFNVLDIGGGWPGNDDHKPSFEDIADAIRDVIDELFPAHVEVIAEPGRYFASASHILVTNIFARREVIKHGVEAADQPDFLYYINDGVYGSFNCLIFDHWEVKIKHLTVEDVQSKNPSEDKNLQLYPSTIFGPTCDSMDKIAPKIMLPKLNVGDFLYIEDFGAYTTAAASAFNGFKTNKLHFVWRN